MSGHTPTPWRNGSWGGRCHKQHRHAVDPKDPCVYEPEFHEGGFDITGPDKQKVMTSTYDGTDISEADMEFILLACNSHAALVAALSLVRMSLGWQYMAQETRDVIDAALAAARGAA